MNGAISTNPSGTPPFIFAWTGPNGFTSTADTLFGLDAGIYDVMMIDGAQDTTYNSTEVMDQPDLGYGGGPTWAGVSGLLGYWGGACVGQCNGAGAFVEAMIAGTGPISYGFDVPATYLGDNEWGHPVYGGFCLGETVNYSMMDQLGCTGSGQFAVYGVDSTWFVELSNLQGSCSGGTGGSITAASPVMFGWTMTLNLRLNGVLVDTQNGMQADEFIFSDLAPGDYDLETIWTGTQCTQDTTFTIPDLGTACGAINGTSWYDVNGDCVHDIGEVGIPNSVLSVQPLGYYAVTHADGSYSLNLPDGSYTLEQTDATLVPICPPAQPVPFTIASAPFTLDLANGSTEPLDLDVYTVSGPARPGFDHQLYGNVVNTSPQVSGPLTLTWTIDPTLVILNAVPAPTTTVGNTLTWSLPALGSFGTASVHVTTNVPVGTALGTVLNSTFTASNTLPEVTLANNTEVEQRTVTGSFDPNEKEVFTSTRWSNTLYFIGSDTYLDYTIHFQNTGTDTAFTVVVTDTLPAELDMASYVQGPSSHTCTTDFLPDRVVRWTFSNILLVDSTTNEALSHGLTSFRIHLSDPVLPGISISNAADIFFDFNPPVRTPDAVITTDIGTGTGAVEANELHVVPNPACDRIVVVGAPGAVRARIVAADGRVLSERSLNGNAVIDIGTLEPGSYVLQLFTAKGATRSLRFVKQ